VLTEFSVDALLAMAESAGLGPGLMLDGGPAAARSRKMA
jgi:hypothetical protein